MNSAIEKFEEAKVKKLARDYESRGYEVEVEPRGKAVPQFLRELNYQPDLVAISEDEKLIVEVKSRKSIRNDKRLSLVARAIENSDEWKFVLVYTNPKNNSSSIIAPPQLNHEEINAAVDYGVELASQSNNEYARVTSLMLVWSAIEAALRSLSFNGVSLKSSSPQGLIRDAVVMGLIGPESYNSAIPIIEKRNRAAHGALLVDISRSDIEELASVCKEILRYGDVQQNDEGAT